MDSRTPLFTPIWVWYFQPCCLVGVFSLEGERERLVKTGQVNHVLQFGLNISLWPMSLRAERLGSDPKAKTAKRTDPT